MVPVEPDLKVPSTGPEATRLVPYMLTSSSSSVSARVPVEARAPGFKLACLRLFQAVNPVSGHLLGHLVIQLFIHDQQTLALVEVE